MVVNNGILLICIRLFMIYLFFYGICSLSLFYIEYGWVYGFNMVYLVIYGLIGMSIEF